MSDGKAANGAVGCKNTLRRAHKPASANFVPMGTVLRSSTRAVATPCSTSEFRFSGVPFASEPGMITNIYIQWK